MRVFARVVPTVTAINAMSVPSGPFRSAGHEPDSVNALQWRVGRVCPVCPGDFLLPHVRAHARDNIKAHIGRVIYSLGICFLSGQAGQVKKTAENVK